jgi:hypothetical protein
VTALTSMVGTSSFSTSTTAAAVEETRTNLRPSSAPESRGGVAGWRSLVVLLLPLLVGLAYWFNPPMNVQPKAGVILDLPVIVGDYFGRDGVITQAELDILPKDTEFARREYEDSHGRHIKCSIILSGSEQRSIHRPEGCLVAQGWTISGQDNIPIPLPSGHTLLARRLMLQRQAPGPDNQMVTIQGYFIYWFVGQNVTTPSHFYRILLSNWDRVIHNRAHRWAYVSVFSEFAPDEALEGWDAAQTQKALTDFTSQIVPTFQIDEMPQQAKN